MAILGYDPERFAAEKAVMDTYKDTYVDGRKGDGKGYDAYHNTRHGLTRDKNGKPQIPAGAVVALVNGECSRCHTFLSLAEYPTQTADGRKIYYIDMHTEQGRKDAEALGLKGDAGKDMYSTAVGRLRLNGELLRERDGSEVPKAIWPVLLNVKSDGSLSTTVYSSGIIDSVEEVTGKPISAAKARADKIVREKPNTAIAGDTSPQPNYMAAPQAQRDLIDRAIYGRIMRREGNPADYADSQSIEMAIERDREAYAVELKQNPRATTGKLRDMAEQSPDAATSRRMLNAVIAAHGDQCGCDEFAPKINLDQFIKKPAQREANR